MGGRRVESICRMMAGRIRRSRDQGRGETERVVAIAGLIETEKTIPEVTKDSEKMAACRECSGGRVVMEIVNVRWERSGGRRGLEQREGGRIEAWAVVVGDQ